MQNKRTVTSFVNTAFASSIICSGNRYAKGDLKKECRERVRETIACFGAIQLTQLSIGVVGRLLQSSGIYEIVCAMRQMR